MNTMNRSWRWYAFQLWVLTCLAVFVAALSEGLKP